jgi:hypothetical protein
MKLLYCLCILVFPVSSYAQINPFDFSNKWIFLHDGNSLVNTGISFAIPVLRSERMLLATGMNTDWYRNNLEDDSIGIKDLYRLSTPVVLQVKLPDRFKINLVVDPSLSSDFEDISMDDFRFNAAIRVVRTKLSGYSWSAGIAVSKQFFGIQIVPFYQTTIPVTSKLIFSGTLPLKPKLTWQFSEARAVGVALSASSASFRLSNEKNSRYMDNKQAEFFFFYQQRLVKNLFATVNLGQTFIYRARVFEDDQKIPLRLFLLDFGYEREPVSSWKSKGLAFQIQIAYKFKGETD